VACALKINSAVGASEASAAEYREKRATMRVLIACECSGTVRDAFNVRGHDAWSCDIVASDTVGNHIQTNVLNILNDGWDMAICHPPCTYLSNAGMRWFKTQPGRTHLAQEALEFVLCLANADIPMIAIENPRGLLTKWWRRADQVIQPWQFGEKATKETHLWLKNLPPLLYTNIHTSPIVNWTEKGHRSQKDRSKTFPGVAAAMAAQWGGL